jgi:hypothetical protein
MKQVADSDSRRLFAKLDPERFPHMSDRLQLLISYLFSEFTQVQDIAAIKVNETGEVRVQWIAYPETWERLGHEAELGEQLRRLAAVAKLTQEERKDYEELVLRRLGISLALRHSCHIKV